MLGQVCRCHEPVRIWVGKYSTANAKEEVAAFSGEQQHAHAQQGDGFPRSGPHSSPVQGGGGGQVQLVQHCLYILLKQTVKILGGQ